jgi:BlaI family penicillinase repressor
VPFVVICYERSRLEDMERRSEPELGRLESAVMAVLWQRPEATVNDVLEVLNWDRPLAYTTVMTVLNRLVDKGFARRELRGRAARYWPAVEQSTARRSALQRVVDRFYGGLRADAVAELLGGSDELSDEELADLEELVRQRRGRQQGR